MLDLRSAVAHGQALLAQCEHRDPQTWCRSGLGAGTWYRWRHARMLDLSARFAVDEGETSGLAAELERVAIVGGMRVYAVIPRWTGCSRRWRVAR